MYTWYVRVHTKSGKALVGKIKDDSTSSMEIANKYFLVSYQLNQRRFIDLTGERDDIHLFICISDIEAYEISASPFN